MLKLVQVIQVFAIFIIFVLVAKKELVNLLNEPINSILFCIILFAIIFSIGYYRWKGLLKRYKNGVGTHYMIFW